MKRILVVDDSKSIRESLSNLISNELAYEVVCSNSYKNTAEVLLKYKGKFDAALLDLGLPDSTNGEIVDFVTKFDIPSIILTGSSLKEDEQKYRNKNIVDYVIKDGIHSLNYALFVIKRIINNQKIKVLIVDDSKTSLDLIKDLTSRYRLNSFTATNGEEALDILENNPDIKLVLTDYAMPKMDGLELTRKLRKKYKKDELSIIVTSASGEKEISSKFLKYGANDYIHKGFSEEEFFARINANLEILELFEDARNKANKDFLTGMYNRRYLFDIGSSLYAKFKKEKKDFAAIIIDIDKFKNINDTYGHDIGDIAIKEVAKILEENFTKDDIIARLGGEEFCVLVSKKNEEETKLLLENVRKTFEENIINIDDLIISYTVSIGCSFDFGENLDDMLQKADKYLYSAKSNGRNQIRYRT